MTAPGRRALLAALAWICLDAAVPVRGDAVQGITISTHRDGRDWAWDSIRPTLDDVKSLGANWVTIHPYAGIGADGHVRFRPIDPSDPPEHVLRPIREAHARGLKILIKPHLAYWGSPFAWRGDIDFARPEQWTRFWNDYREWIVALAAVSAEADGFAVGTELDQTAVSHEAEWRRVIADVRRVSGSPLTYAANWDGYETVPFWDALDAVGIQAYFPLTDEGPVTVEAIRDGWSAWMARLGRFAAERERPIVFTELGYTHSWGAAARPWEHRNDGEDSRWVQEACMREALAAIEREPAVIGAFLWKWFPEPRPLGRNYQLATPGMRAVIRRAWSPAPPAADPARP